MSNQFLRNLILGTAIFFTFTAGNRFATAQDDASAVNTAAPASTMPSDIDPNGPLAQVIKLAQSGVEQSVILSYINSSTAPFSLTPDQIIYLKDLGLPNDAVTAMMQRDQQLGAAAATPAPAVVQTTAAPEVTVEQPQEVTQNYFYDTLSPYGGWVNIDGYGLCWQPTVVVYNTSWQPYCDHGHWVNTDSGWFWLSDYSWGATAFHYGRWFRDARRGWCWWPDTTWAPSWVTWRNTPTDDYCGWAPLPPHTSFRPGAGIFFNGVAVAANFDFGLNLNCFTFVPTRNFCDPHPVRYRPPQTQIVQIYNRTTIVNNYNVNSRDKTIINVGIAPERITSVTRTTIPRYTLQDSARPVGRGEQINKNALIVNRPQITQTTVNTLNRGVRPVVVRQNTPRPNVINNDNRGNLPTHATIQNPRPNNFTTPNNNNDYNSSANRPGNLPQNQTTAPSRDFSNHNSVSTPQTQRPVVTPEKTFTESKASTSTVTRPDYNQRYISPRQQDLQGQSRSQTYNSNPQSTQNSGGGHASFNGTHSNNSTPPQNSNNGGNQNNSHH